MAAAKFFVNNGQNNVGPFEMKVIIEKVTSGELKATDTMCISVDNDEWILICQHEDFLKAFKPGKPSAKHEEKVQSKPESVKQASVNTIVIPENHIIPSAPVKIATPSEHKSVEVAITPANGPAVANIPEVSVAQTGGNQPIPESHETTDGDLTSAQWFVLKGKNRFGPFMYLDVVRMLQEKSVFEYDYVWAQGLDKWKRIAELSCFDAEHIRALFGSKDSDEKLFYRRSFPRARYETSLICHDNNNVWRGKTVEIGEGGAGVIIENAMILPGQNVYMHFRPGPLSKPFNVLCEVVSKRYVKGIKDADAPVLYGIKFINIQKSDRDAIKLIHTAA